MQWRPRLLQEARVWPEGVFYVTEDPFVHTSAPS
jgi:hypothetical protein